MSTGIKKQTSVGVEIESSEGTYVAPSASTSFVQTLADGFELSPSKQLLERNIFTASIGKTSPLTGEFQVKGTLPVEARAHSTAGHAPEYDALMKSALGNRRQITTTTTTKTGNSGYVLQIEDADIGKYTIGDIVVVEESGAYHVSPIIDKSSGTGTATITLLVHKPSGSFSDNVVVSKSTTYIVADSGHPALSISKYINSAVLEQAVGCRVDKLELDKFATGQIPSFKFGFEGLNFDRSVTAIPYTPSYDSALPPIMLGGGMYMDGSAIEVNELKFSLENKLGFETSIAAPNGRVAGFAVERTISGSINPYKPDDSVANFTKYKENTAFSLFAYGCIPTGVTGEFGNVVAVYLPNCIITEMGEADQDGLLQDSITFSANRGSTGANPDIYVGFI